MASRDTGPILDPALVQSVADELALGGEVCVVAIAGRLGTSSRTLQRRLAQQGISLRAVVAESRMAIARVLLCKTDLDVQEIAVRAGYSTPSSFSRAFVRWAGCAPLSYRKVGKRSDCR